ncbi:YidB family protein [Bradyrhizobium sp. 930_D9_N1_4]|uniref:YidB family protein n=1 Tax=Bradyrhizobium sp. 930_D9_N1_4 TaxID=3240374 RepID=UPI003F8A5352
MGLLDVLNGMQNGPRGQSTPSSEQSSGGMSPMTMAIIALLGWKAFKHLTAGQSGAAPQQSPTPTHLPPPVNAGAGGGLGGALAGGGGLGDLLKGGLGGLLAGGAAGSVLSGGLGDLLNQLQQGGHGDAAKTWVGKGENKAIAPGDLASALGADQIESLTAQSGLSREDLLSGLSQYLPQVVDHLTPDGRLPTENELSGRI